MLTTQTSILQKAASVAFLVMGADCGTFGMNAPHAVGAPSELSTSAALPTAELSSQATPAPAEQIERRLGAMGTWLDITLSAGDRPSGLLASESAVRAIEAVEARLSSWRKDSELSRLNAAACGEFVPLSAQLRADLATVDHYWRSTQGAFDPSIGALVAAYELRQAGHWPTPAQLATARVPGGFGALEITPAGAIRNHPALQLDAGSFGKGLGLDAAINALREAGIEHARIDLGGQVSILGSAIELPLSHPTERDRPLLKLRLGSGSCATSGNATRSHTVSGKQLGHILDPRTARPVQNFGSVTVLAPTGVQADCLSTALYVMGPTAALSYAEQHDQIEVLILEASAQGLRARASSGLDGKLFTYESELPLDIDFDSPMTTVAAFKVP